MARPPLLLLLLVLAPLTGAELHILPLGDSITQADDPGYRGFLYRMLVDAGYEVDFVGTNHGLPSLPRDADLDGDHQGHGGFTVGPGPSAADDWSGGKGNLVANLPTWLAPDDPATREVDIVLLLIGINDLANIGERDPGYDLERDFVGRYAGLLDEILRLRPEACVLMSSVLPGGNRDKGWVFAMGPFERINAALPALAAARGNHVHFYDGYTLQGTDLAWEASDWPSGDVVHPAESGYRKLAAFWFAAIRDVIENERLPTTAYQAPPRPAPVAAAESYRADFAAGSTGWRRIDEVAMDAVDGRLVAAGPGQCRWVHPRPAVPGPRRVIEATLVAAQAERVGLLVGATPGGDGLALTLARDGGIELHRIRGDFYRFHLNGNATRVAAAEGDTGAGRRYRLRIVLDLEAGTCDAEVDGRRVFTAEPLRGATGDGVGFVASYNATGAGLEALTVTPAE